MIRIKIKIGPQAGRGLLGAWGVAPDPFGAGRFRPGEAGKRPAEGQVRAPEYQGRCTKRPLSHQFRQADRWALKCWFLRLEQRCYGKREAPVIVLAEERET